MTEEYDVTQPILILVRRGRGDRGYLVAAVDDASNPFSCTDDGEVGSAVVELLNDPKQPRFDEKQLEAAAADHEEDDEESEEDVEDDDEGEDEEEEEDDSSSSDSNMLDELGLDPAEKLSSSSPTRLVSQQKSTSKKKKKRCLQLSMRESELRLSWACRC